MKEIEIKAHVLEPVKTEAVITAFAGSPRHFSKKDVYWTQTNTGKRIRIRTETEYTTKKNSPIHKTIIITYKKKFLQNNTEINDEIEFTIDAKEEFEKFISDLDFLPQDKKEKDTRSWSILTAEGWPLTIELSRVDPIGWFLELEILLENPSQTAIDACNKTLYATLARCSIDEKNIETAFYSDMLRAVQ